MQLEQLHNNHAVHALYPKPAESPVQRRYTVMSKNRYITLLLPVVVGCVSCQQGPAPGGSVGVRNYADAVVHIGQVDPAYQAYFREQNAANYSLSDQRRAYVAAAQTARTPVRASDYHPGSARRASSRAQAARRKSENARRHAVAVRRRSTQRR